MDGLQVSIICLLLKMTFDPIAAQLLPRPRDCPICSEGYFVARNCSVTNGNREGVQCSPCTNCSAADQDTLVKCSTYADSLCGKKIPPTETAVSAPDVWIVLTVIGIFLFLVLLLALFLVLRSCKNRQRNTLKGLDPL